MDRQKAKRKFPTQIDSLATISLGEEFQGISSRNCCRGNLAKLENELADPRIPSRFQTDAGGYTQSIYDNDQSIYKNLAKIKKNLANQQK